MKTSRLMLIFLLTSSLSEAATLKSFAKSQVLADIVVWQSSIESNPNLGKTEKRKELDFVSRLQGRVQQEPSTEISLLEVKLDLEFLLKNNQRGSNAFFASETPFLKDSIELLDSIEPMENPIQVLKNYLEFSSIEKPKSVREFEMNRSYINHSTSISADPDDLDDAATTVEHKIFSHQDSENLL